MEVNNDKLKEEILRVMKELNESHKKIEPLCSIQPLKINKKSLPSSSALKEFDNFHKLQFKYCTLIKKYKAQIRGA